MAILKAKSGIHIKPENKGKFTATKKKTGKSTAELKHSKNPLTRKRATFAQNAKTWAKNRKKKNCGGLLRMQEGGKFQQYKGMGSGFLQNNPMPSPEEIKRRAVEAQKQKMREDLEYANNMIMGGAGTLKNVTVGVGREVAALNNFLKNKKSGEYLRTLGKETTAPRWERWGLATDDMARHSNKSQGGIEYMDEMGKLFDKAAENPGFEPSKFDFDKLAELLKKKPNPNHPGLNRPGMNQDGGVMQRQSFDTM
jgi:hypothetical protein